MATNKDIKKDEIIEDEKPVEKTTEVPTPKKEKVEKPKKAKSVKKEKVEKPVEKVKVVTQNDIKPPVKKARRLWDPTKTVGVMDIPKFKTQAVKNKPKKKNESN